MRDPFSKGELLAETAEETRFLPLLPLDPQLSPPPPPPAARWHRPEGAQPSHGLRSCFLLQTQEESSLPLLAATRKPDPGSRSTAAPWPFKLAFTNESAYKENHFKCEFAPDAARIRCQNVSNRTTFLKHLPWLITCEGRLTWMPLPLKLSPDMAGWFKWLPWKSRQGSDSSRSPLNNTSPSLPPHRLEWNSNSLPSSSVNSPKQTSCTFAVNITNSDSARWNKQYDACICHSEGDFEFVEQMVSYLESQPEHFRCFLQLRDAVPGGAIPSELCEAVQNSHCWVLLITSSFLKDPWCVYQMHQALMEAPMANGRIIPVLKDIDRKDYPRELKCIYYINVTVQEKGFRQVKETVIRYLQELCQNAHRSI